MRLARDSLDNAEVHTLLQEHLNEMALHSPAESIHALDLDALRHSSVDFWSLWDGDQVIGCCALKNITYDHGEIKSMRLTPAYRGQGLSKKLLQFLFEQAEQKGLRKLSLETGSMAAFEPARKLYENFGFRYCSPFASYKEDPNSVFMTIDI